MPDSSIVHLGLDQRMHDTYARAWIACCIMKGEFEVFEEFPWQTVTDIKFKQNRFEYYIIDNSPDSRQYERKTTC